MTIDKPIRFADDGTIFIGIGRGLEARIDQEDFDRPLPYFFTGDEQRDIRISDYRWSAIGDARRGYYAGICISGGLSRQRHAKMHRLIIGAKPGQIVDHKNHIKTDNRNENLRIVTNAQNTRWHNGKKNVGNSRFNGVHWDKHIQRWRAQTSFNDKRVHIGVFSTEIDAALAYDAKARELFGEFAKTNF